MVKEISKYDFFLFIWIIFANLEIVGTHYYMYDFAVKILKIKFGNRYYVYKMKIKLYSNILTRFWISIIHK